VEGRLKERRARLSEGTLFSRGGGLLETAADRDLGILLQLVSHWESIRASQFLLDPVLRIRDVYPGSDFFPSRI
jgi:hypothetical protein